MRLRIAASFLILAMTSVGMGASVDVARYEKTLEAKKLLKTLGFIDRYLLGQEDFLAHLAKEPDMSADLHRTLAKVLKESDYEGRLADMVGLFMTRDDLIATNKYNAGAAGQKEVAMMLRLERMVKQGELDTSEITFEREVFFSNLTDVERQEVLAFYNSDSGQRYWKALGAIDGQLRTVFAAIFQTAMPKALEMWNDQINEANQPATPPTKAGPPPARQETRQPK